MEALELPAAAVTEHALVDLQERVQRREVREVSTSSQLSLQVTKPA